MWWHYRKGKAIKIDIPAGDLSTTIESFRLEKTFKIIEPNCKPNTAKSTTKPCP